MIRKHRKNDLDQILNIWNESSSMAHPFLKATFVQKVKEDMRNIYIPDSDTWVFENDKEVIGFISMIGNEIGGLFVVPESHGSGVGTKMLDFISKKHELLEVEVFEKNNIGRSFYKKQGFNLDSKYDHTESGETVLRLKR